MMIIIINYNTVFDVIFVFSSKHYFLKPYQTQQPLIQIRLSPSKLTKFSLSPRHTFRLLFLALASLPALDEASAAPYF